jgi:hypothetical protein
MTDITLKDVRPNSAADASASGYHVEEIQRRHFAELISIWMHGPSNLRYKTSVGIDANTTPAAVSIAYDRTDGYLGPHYEDGTIPPVVSSIQSDLSTFNPQIRQVAWVVVSQGLLSEALE